MKTKQIFTTERGNSLKFKGDILIVDPCYLKDGILEKEWSEFCSAHWTEDNIIVRNGAKMLVSGTAYGDGCFYPKTNLKTVGEECGVDAGMLCIVHVKDLRKFGKYDGRLGVIIKGVDDEIKADGHGNFIGKQVEVFTDGSDAEEEDEDELY